MSLMIANRDSPDCWIVRVRWRCRVSNAVVSKSSVMPRTPFMGVRISWLMLARNCDFVRLAASATSLASSNSCVVRFSGVMSEATARCPVILPSASRSAVIFNNTVRLVPSFRI